MLRVENRSTTAGFTIVELAIAIVTSAILVAISFSAYKDYNESVIARKAADQMAADLALARSHAIKRRTNVSMVLDEGARSYEIRAEDGTVMSRRYFDDDSDLPVSSLEIPGGVDSITFNSRGFVSGALLPIRLTRGSRGWEVTMNAVGRTSVSDYP